MPLRAAFAIADNRTNELSEWDDANLLQTLQAMDPADVLKVMRQETGGWIKDPAHPVAAPVMKGLFGRWEGNWVAWNTAHDIVLPGSTAKGTLPFLMYPQGENDKGRFDELSPDTFRYTISAKEVGA